MMSMLNGPKRLDGSNPDSRIERRPYKTAASVDQFFVEIVAQFVVGDFVRAVKLFYQVVVCSAFRVALGGKHPGAGPSPKSQ